jgi:predicted RND superfamily exporter protein
VVLGSDLAGRFDDVLGKIREFAPRETWISGVPVFRTEINRKTGSEIFLFSFLTVLVVSAVLFLGFGSIVAVICPLLVGGVSALILLGVMGFIGFPLTLSTMILPSIMLALGCAYAMHIVAAAVWGVGGAIEDRLAAVVLPVALSGLTTTIGFLAISATRIEAIREVGTMGALGALVAVSGALSLAPALLARWEPRKSGRPIALVLSRKVAVWLLALVVTQRGWIIGASVLVSLICVYGLSLLSIETDATRWFVSGSEVRESYESIRRELSGISPLNVVIKAEQGHSVVEADVLAAIDELSLYLRTIPDVGKVVTIVDPLKQIHSAMAADDFEGLPRSRSLIEQYLLLLSGARNLSDLVTSDRSGANIILRVDNNGSRHLISIAKRAEEWWHEHGAEGVSARTTGIMYEFARAQEEISHGQIRGLLFALACVSIVLIAAFGSFRIAMSALFPNTIPIAAAYGLMGLMGASLDAGTVLVGSIALGIAVDDTVHLVNGFCEGREKGLCRRAAVRGAFDRVLIPLILTTCAVGLGFGVLGFSEFSFTRNLGVLTAGIMVMCLAADCLLLPSLLVGERPRLTRRKRDV